MKNMKLKILKMVREKKSIKPKEIIELIAKNKKQEINAESALRSMVAQGMVILNFNRKIVLPRKSSL